MVRCLIAFTILLFATTAMALRTGSAGNEPIQRESWPKGVAEVANLQTRVGYWDGPMGGDMQFLYRGDTEDFQEALDLFAKTDSPRRMLIVEQGPGDRFAPGEEKGTPVDWELLVTDAAAMGVVEGQLPAAFAAQRQRVREAPPTLRVFVAGEGVDGISFDKLRIPAGVTVQDTRATAHGYTLADASVVRGTVSEIGSGRAIPGAEVMLRNRTQEGLAPSKATADANGRFELKRLAGGDYEVRASADGLAPRNAGYARLSANSLEEFAIALAPSAELSGRAVDLAGKPLAGVTVRPSDVVGPDGRAYGTEAIPVSTDQQGRFVIAGLPQGQVQLMAYDKSHLLSDSLNHYRVPAKDVTLKLLETGRLKGKLLTPADPTGGQRSVHITPEGGNKIGSWGGSKYVDPDGTFTFDQVPPGRYVVSADSSEGTGKPIEIKPGQDTEVVIEGNDK